MKLKHIVQATIAAAGLLAFPLSGIAAEVEVLHY
jgi:hypothetical protein